MRGRLLKILGIDPGKRGGLVELIDGKIHSAAPMPVITGAKAKDVFDLSAIHQLIQQARPLDMVVIEKLHAMPNEIVKEVEKDGRIERIVTKSGSLANFNRGYALGSLEGMLVALNQRYALVAPQTWQSAVLKDVNCTDTKQAALVVARRFWPAQNWLAGPRSKKPHDGLVDAACIAMFWHLRK